MTETARLIEQAAQARRLADLLTDPGMKQTLIDYALDKEQRLAVLTAHQTEPTPSRQAAGA